jgi:quercetin dioxygenase-like cupin family protein
MRESLTLATPIVWIAALAAASAPLAALAQHAGVAKPELVLRNAVDAMPRGERQEISVLTATLAPGERTVVHTHRFPVTVYILQGEFTLEMEGRPAVTVRAGESMVEPPQVTMTGYNRGAIPMKVVIFYVSEPGMPFLDPVHR